MQVVAGAGAIDHSQLVDLAGKSFADLPTDPTTADDLVKKVTSLHVHNHRTAGTCADFTRPSMPGCMICNSGSTADTTGCTSYFVPVL